MVCESCGREEPCSCNERSFMGFLSDFRSSPDVEPASDARPNSSRGSVTAPPATQVPVWPDAPPMPPYVAPAPLTVAPGNPSPWPQDWAALPPIPPSAWPGDNGWNPSTQPWAAPPAIP